MAFTLSGTTITQTGTDTNLSGLSGIAGVTVVGTARKKTYVFSNTRLVVSGALSFDPELEALEFDELCTAPQLYITGAAGVLTIGVSGKAKPWALSAVTCRKQEASYSIDQIRVDNSAVLTFYYGSIHLHGSLSILSTARLCTLGGYLHLDYPIGPNIGRYFPWRSVTYLSTFLITGNGIEMKSTNANIDSLTIADARSIGLHASLFGSLTSPYTLNGVTLLNANLYPWHHSVWDAVGFAGGGTLLKSGAGNTTYSILIRTFGLLDAKVYVGSTPIQNAIVFSRDTDNGQRVSIPCTDGIYDATLDTTTIYQTNVSGATGSQRYLLHNWSRSVAGVIKSDWRTLLPNANTRRITALGYSIKANQLDVDMTNGGTNTIPLYCESDTNVTLSENDAVAKLASSFSVNSGTNTITVTANSTLDDLYDAMKAFKTRAVTAQLEYPTIATQPVNASGTNLVTAMSVVGIEFLTTGTKFKTLQANATANGTISNLSIVGDISQATPTNLSNVQISGTLTYNTNTDTTITIIDTNINTVENIGTGIITINKVNSTIDNYTDAEINFNDSTISVIGADTVTFHPTANDRDLNVNASGSFSGSYAFKFGSTINGSTMSDTLYLRCVAGVIPFNIDKSIVLGDNLVDLGTTAQLASLSAKIDLTAKESTLLQTRVDIITEINANETKIDTAITKIDTKPTLTQIEGSTELAKESSVQLAIAVSV